MTKGAFVTALELCIIVECSGQKVKRIYLSQGSPDEPSLLAERIAAHLEKGAPCPSPDLDISRSTDFQKRVYSVVRGIGRGKTLTYGEVAFLAQCPKGARAVGSAMATNPFAILVPCHRVVARKGLGGFAWGLEVKERMLALERNDAAEMTK